MEEIIQLLKNIEKRLDSIEEHIGIVGKVFSMVLPLTYLKNKEY